MKALKMKKIDALLILKENRNKSRLKSTKFLRLSLTKPHHNYFFMKRTMNQEDSFPSSAHISLKDQEIFRSTFDTPEIEIPNDIISSAKDISIRSGDHQLESYNHVIQVHQEQMQNNSQTKRKSQRTKANKNQGKKRKNNNVIKKYGRILNNHLHKYIGKDGKFNEGIQKMFDRLQIEMKTKKKKADMMDLFNTYHLNMLLNDCDEETGSENLNILQQILKKNLRKEVLFSSQLTEEKMLMYLNTLKLSQLRTINKKLALRLRKEEIEPSPTVIQEEVKEENQPEIVFSRDVEWPMPSQEESLIHLANNI